MFVRAYLSPVWLTLNSAYDVFASCQVDLKWHDYWLGLPQVVAKLRKLRIDESFQFVGVDKTQVVDGLAALRVELVKQQVAEGAAR